MYVSVFFSNYYRRKGGLINVESCYAYALINFWKENRVIEHIMN